MVDIHSHLIHNIDDGAKSLEDTIQIIKEASQNGFNKIVTTPHYIEDYYEFSNTSDIVKALQKKIEQIGIDMQVYTGHEVYINLNITDLIKENKLQTINNSKYLLIELPMQAKPIYAEKILFNIINLGIIPIIAHPERYVYVQQDENILDNMINSGALLQGNFGSIVDMYGRNARKTLEKLLKKDKISFMASDVHRPNSIYIKMPKIIKKLEKIVGRQQVELLTNTNPSLVLENKNL